MLSEEIVYNTIVLSLVRIFTEYGWEDKTLPHLSDKVRYIEQGIAKGDGNGYYTHFSMILQARKKDHKWGLFSEEYMVKVDMMLKHFNKIFHWFDPGYDKPIKTTLNCRVNGNYFQKSPAGKEAIHRLERFGKTSVSYKVVEEYGVKTLQKQLRAAGYPNATVKVAMDSYEPDYYFDDVYTEIYPGKYVRMYWPIMPIVVISKE